jgi:hypothetical protein
VLWLMQADNLLCFAPPVVYADHGFRPWLAGISQPGGADGSHGPGSTVGGADIAYL